jgi:hypothetical protein
MELLGKISAEFNVDIPFSLDALTVMGVKAQIEQLIKQKDSGSSNLASLSLSHSTLSSLSSTQRQLWYLSRNANNTAYNMIIACKTTNLNLEKFKKSIANLVANHPMLSAMVTCSDDGDPLLRIGDFSLGEIFSEENSPKEESGIIQDITNFSEIPMNVEKGPLFLVKVVKCSSAPASVFFAIKIHHLICDGFSQDIIMNEIMKFYHLIQPSEVTKINEVLLPSFILSNEDKHLHKILEIWKEEYSDTCLLPFPKNTFKSNSLNTNPPGKTASFLLTESHMDSLKILCQIFQTTSFVVLLSIFETLLFRYFNSSDFCIGIPISTRDSTNGNSIGCYINTISVPTDTKSSSMTFASLVNNCKTRVKQLMEFRFAPYDKLLTHLRQPKNGNSRSELFNVMFVMQPPKTSQGPWAESFELLDIPRNSSMFDLSLSCEEIASGNKQSIKCLFEYRTDVLEDIQISR